MKRLLCVAFLLVGSLFAQTVPRTHSNPFLSANTARVDPSGDDSTGTIGDLGKPFLTVQALLDKGLALSLPYVVIDIGSNGFNENLVTDFNTIYVIGTDSRVNQAWNSLTFTSGNGFVALNGVFAGGITGATSVEANRTELQGVTSTGDLSVVSYDGGTTLGISVTCNGDLTLKNLFDGGATVTVTGTHSIQVVDCLSAVGSITAANCNVTATRSLIGTTGPITCNALTLIDSRVLGTNNAASTVYADVLLLPRYQMSINFDATAGLKLVNDSATPGNSKYYGTDSGGTKGYFALPTGGAPGGSTTQVQYNNAGAFGGITGATTDGTILTLTTPTINSGGANFLNTSAGIITLKRGGSSVSSFTSTLPEANTTLVGVDNIATLTNKTLTTPTINSGGANFLNTSAGQITLKRAGTSVSAFTVNLPEANTTLTGIDTIDTLTNKTLTTPTIGSGGANFLNPSAGIITLKRGGSSVSSFTSTLPEANTTLVGTDTTDTLTNKTINGASNTLTVRVANDISGLGTGVATFLATPSFANFNAATTGDDAAGLAAGNTFTGANANSFSGTASTPAMKYSGVPFAGTGTTSFPLFYINDANATASTTLNTAGTYLGVNGDGTQDLMNLLKDGTSQFLVSSTGAVTSVGAISSGNQVISTIGAGNSAFKIQNGTNSYISWNGVGQVRFPADGVLNLMNDAGTGFTRIDFGGTTNSFPAIGRDAVNGFTAQSAAGTSTWNDASTANSGTVANRYMVGVATPTLTATNTSVTDTVASTVYIGGAPTASTNTTITTPYALNVAAGVTNLAGPVVVSPGYTVATLPSTASGGKVTGARAYVTDAVAPTFLGALTGGGSTITPVFYNGTAWVSE